ncbi:hypothetical protein TGPRC2_423780 [Toxoplasma gondii TgCatPRC2]|uniref:Uncharacterized protein n=1 Tax=Toxoplasma gondii TgCatPRC2 TaxID=1130821 RepID=A0A151HLG4_TOXGO|nr:hypothetical protein TGPRC2_423780 [Toxoplasma gondii TgCatPRC2]
MSPLHGGNRFRRGRLATVDDARRMGGFSLRVAFLFLFVSWCLPLRGFRPHLLESSRLLCSPSALMIPLVISSATKSSKHPFLSRLWGMCVHPVLLEAEEKPALLFSPLLLEPFHTSHSRFRDLRLRIAFAFLEKTSNCGLAAAFASLGECVCRSRCTARRRRRKGVSSILEIVSVLTEVLHLEFRHRMQHGASSRCFALRRSSICFFWGLQVLLPHPEASVRPFQSRRRTKRNRKRMRISLSRSSLAVCLSHKDWSCLEKKRQSRETSPV